jgi:hypothetical protein
VKTLRGAARRTVALGGSSALALEPRDLLAEVIHHDRRQALRGLVEQEQLGVARRGDLFVGSLQPGRLVRLRLADGRVVIEERYVIDPGERVRDVRQGRDGLIHLLIDNPQGRIVRLEPTPGS